MPAQAECPREGEPGRAGATTTGTLPARLLRLAKSIPAHSNSRSPQSRPLEQLLMEEHSARGTGVSERHRDTQTSGLATPSQKLPSSEPGQSEAANV